MAVPGLFEAWDIPPNGRTPSVYKGKSSDAAGYAAESAEFQYPLKFLPNLPPAFKKAEIDVLDQDLLAEVVNRFRWDAEIFNLAKTDSRRILMERYEIFSHLREAPEEIRAKLALRELSRRAERCLVDADRDGFLDKRALYERLLERLKAEADNRGLSGFDTKDDLKDGLARILALRPSLLQDAVSETFSRHTVSISAAPLPPAARSAAALAGGRLNLYGIFPADLNNWVRPFAEMVDNDLSGTVAWWHRNPVRKAHSVSIPIPGHGFFYPDLILGVNGRATENGILLVEIKHQINDPEGNAAAKAVAVHPDYGPVLMLYYDERSGDWMTVAYDRASDRNIRDRVFRMEMLRTW